MIPNNPYATPETEPEPVPPSLSSIVVPGWIIGVTIGAFLNNALPFWKATAFTVACGAGVATLFQLTHWWRLRQVLKG